MKPFQKIFTNKLEKGMSTFFKNNIKNQGRVFSTKTESHLIGIGIDNHEPDLKTQFVIKEEKKDNPTYVNGVGIDNYESKPLPFFFTKKEKNDIPSCVNGIGIDNYEPLFSK
ncbi:hypothetical protein Lsan_1501 [Legionella santicrucis]|uniref:Uncharacterized protein n=1 Tax=Legionella santicrucis TaxID=45074 RepID=A0A0W0Z214_9GAMM|nr:hypothetical protein [Legionella santicrucis]KTD63147.1 hypothetical protein Lsan_1501 [Legionella santicrucis]